MSLNSRIAQFYNRSTQLWLDTWGEQMHHGYYGPDGQQKVDHQQAQLDMIEALIQWGAPDLAERNQPLRILDAGCGVGGSSRYLVQKFPNSTALGATLSQVQAKAGKVFSEKAGLGQQIKLIAQDVYLINPEQHGTFDLIWSMESAEHMADKEGLFQNFNRLLKPGGKLLMATWCHRPTPPDLVTKEQQTLAQIQKLYHLPPLVSIPALATAAETAGLSAIRSDDWSQAVFPFWGAVIKSGLDPRNWPGLIRSGRGTIKGAWAMRYMQRGFKMGSIRYGILRAEKGAI
ncbi:MAG: methyltransferase domain-containing protein [Bacteroidota bacterium]